MEFNLRHLRVFLSASRNSSITKAAEECRLSQPAVTQAINKLEDLLETALFQRSAHGVFVSQVGKVFGRRVERALGLIDASFLATAPRLQVTATAAQLRAFVAVCDCANFTLAARRLGIAQPTVHRAVSQLEKEALKPLLERTSSGIVPSRSGQSLARAADLMFAELAQAAMEMSELKGRESGRIVIGAMPLSRAYILPLVVAAFRKDWPRIELQVLDGPYDELIRELRRGAVDFLVGALRNPLPIEDIEQSALFNDSLTVMARKDHPLAGRRGLIVDDLRSWPWVVAARGTPTRGHFDRLFKENGGQLPESVVESGSMIFARELLALSDHLACVSSLQAGREIAAGRIVALPFRLPDTSRPIGITTRTGWEPTASQKALLALLHRYDH